MIVESAAMRVEVVPETGGKLASLRHRGREWVLAPPNGRPAPPRYGARFTGAPLWGWDEMLPTIDCCWDLPDHGEVWALPRTSEGRERGVRCADRLVDREVRGTTMTLDYQLTAAARLPVLCCGRHRV